MAKTKAVIPPAPVIKKTPWISTTLQYLVLLAVAFLCFRGCNYNLRLPHMAYIMPGYLVLISGLSFAFVWVEVLKWGVIKPFTCLTCMSGWISLLFAFLFNTPFWYLYVGIGYFTSYLFTAVRMRWL